MMCDPLLDIGVDDGPLATALKRKGVTMDQIDPEVSVDEKAEIAQGAAEIAATETEFDPASCIPAEPMDEYQAIITSKEAWIACEDLADMCRAKDVIIAEQRDRLSRMGQVAGSIAVLAQKLETVAGAGA